MFAYIGKAKTDTQHVEKRWDNIIKQGSQPIMRKMEPHSHKRQYCLIDEQGSMASVYITSV